MRVNDLAQIDVAADAGVVNVSLFVAKARQRPIKVRMMERHPLGSQLFFPLQERSWLVLVCIFGLLARETWDFLSPKLVADLYIDSRRSGQETMMQVNFNITLLGLKCQVSHR